MTIIVTIIVLSFLFIIIIIFFPLLLSYFAYKYIYVFGFGLFVGNIIQFGTDQLQFAPSHQLAAFARWFICVFIFAGIPGALAGAIKSNFGYYGICCLCFVLFVGFVITLACCCKHYFTIEPPAHIDPVKMIWRVMKYAWKHKYPVRRSAFTYCDSPPSRLDLAKERYGGPFTTEQVEDVKSFWNILTILIALLGSSILDTRGVGQQYIDAMGINITFTVAFLHNSVIV